VKREMVECVRIPLMELDDLKNDMITCSHLLAIASSGVSKKLRAASLLLLELVLELHANTLNGLNDMVKSDSPTSTAA